MLLIMQKREISLLTTAQVIVKGTVVRGGESVSDYKQNISKIFGTSNDSQVGRLPPDKIKLLSGQENSSLLLQNTHCVEFEYRITGVGGKLTVYVAETNHNELFQRNESENFQSLKYR